MERLIAQLERQPGCDPTPEEMSAKIIEPCADLKAIVRKGWGKELTYIIAFSSMELVDVTRRYVLDPMMNLMRRDKVPEKWLATQLENRREMMWSMQAPVR